LVWFSFADADNPVIAAFGVPAIAAAGGVVLVLVVLIPMMILQRRRNRLDKSSAAIVQQHADLVGLMSNASLITSETADSAEAAPLVQDEREAAPAVAVADEVLTVPATPRRRDSRADRLVPMDSPV
jgi:hypothetical protein